MRLKGCGHVAGIDDLLSAAASSASCSANFLGAPHNAHNSALKDTFKEFKDGCAAGVVKVKLAPSAHVLLDGLQGLQGFVDVGTPNLKMTDMMGASPLQVCLCLCVCVCVCVYIYIYIHIHIYIYIYIYISLVTKWSATKRSSLNSGTKMSNIRH
jgi:hypothetical protein